MAVTAVEKQNCPSPWEIWLSASSLYIKRLLLHYHREGLLAGSSLLVHHNPYKDVSKVKCLQQRIAEQLLKERPRAQTRLLQKSIGCPKESSLPPFQSTYLTGHSEAEPALQLSVQLGTDALAPLLSLLFIWTFCWCSRTAKSSHGCHQEEDADAQARQGKRLGQSWAGRVRQEGSWGQKQTGRHLLWNALWCFYAAVPVSQCAWCCVVPACPVACDRGLICVSLQD